MSGQSNAAAVKAAAAAVQTAEKSASQKKASAASSGLSKAGPLLPPGGMMAGGRGVARAVDTPPIQTLYCFNLNDKIKIPDLVSNLYEYFAPYGEVIDIVAHAGMRKRGQAFVVFSELSSAAQAMRSLQGKAFLGKAMRISYARTKSDATMKLEGTFKMRKAGVGRGASSGQKKGSSASSLSSSTSLSSSSSSSSTSSPNNAANENDASDSTTNNAESSSNRITLFIENLPKEINKKALDILFGQFSGHVESRLIAGRGVAFIDFQTQNQAQIAMNGLQGFKASPDQPIRVSWAHQ